MASPPLSKNAKKKKRQRVVITVLLVFIIVVLSTITVGVVYINYLMNKITYTADPKNNSGSSAISGVVDENLFSDKKVINIMMIGVDTSSSEEVSRSDTMLLLSIDQVHKKIKLTSFLRDTWVTIPEYGDAKLNAAHAFGGPTLLLDTMKLNYNIRVDKYIKVDFSSFQKIVDAMDGVDVELTEAEARYMQRNWYQDVSPGLSTLTGEQALWYCRIRKLDSDFGRTSRQRTVLESIFNKSRDLNLLQTNNLLNKLLPYVETNLTKGELTSLAIGYAMSYKKFEMVQFYLPQDGQYRDITVQGQDALAIDFSLAKTQLYDFVFEDSAASSDEAVEE